MSKVEIISKTIGLNSYELIYNKIYYKLSNE